MKNIFYSEFLSILLLFVLSTHNRGVYSSLLSKHQRNKVEVVEDSTGSQYPAMGMEKGIKQLHQEQLDTQELVNTLAEEVKDMKKYLLELLPSDCYAAKLRGDLKRKVLISPPGLPPRHVVCDQHTAGGGWTVVLDRKPGGDNRENFNCSWETYKSPFGSLDGEFWIGLNVLHALTAETNYEVLIKITDDKSGHSKKAMWKKFRIGSEEDNYRLTIRDYQSGDSEIIHDAMEQHNGKPFATFDRDNTNYIHHHCGHEYGAGWWYSKCGQALLTGDATPARDSHGIRWYNAQAHGTKRLIKLTHATMMIKPTFSH